MNRTDHLLIRLAEECGEVVQRVSKALVFGLAEKQEGQLLTNEERLKGEVIDVIAVLSMLIDAGLDIMPKADYEDAARVVAKRDRVEKYLEYSRKQGRLE
jgi:NTP pyrophosphatase (non-canonical NTP hydrolase)